MKTRPVFNALVLYEDYPAGCRATETCNLLMAKLGGEFELRCSMWKFDVLRNTKLREIAAAEAIEADAIIVAAHGASPLPDEITTWVDAWLTLRGNHPAALIALVDSAFHRGNGNSATFDYLRGVAAAANMDFLPEIITFASIESAAPKSALRPESGGLTAGDFPRWNVSERHWGINE